MVRFGSVYLINNEVTGDQYIGVTRQPLWRRWSTHKSTARSAVSKKHKVQAAICEYGECNFTMLELYVSFSAEDLYQTEIDFIQSYNPKYNTSKGGCGFRPKVYSEAKRKQVSELFRRLWADPEWREKRMLEISRREITEAKKSHMRWVQKQGIGTRWRGHIKKVRILEDNRSALSQASWKDPAIREARISGMKKTFATPEARAKRVVASTGRKMPERAIEASARAKWRPIYCPELQITFLCQKYASEYLGVLRTAICNAIKSGGRVRNGSVSYSFARISH